MQAPTPLTKMLQLMMIPLPFCEKQQRGRQRLNFHSDAALASATPPIAWQELRLGQKLLERDLSLPLHKSSNEEARAQARKPQVNNQWLTPFDSSNASGSLDLSFQPDGHALPEHFAFSENEEDEFAQLDYPFLIAKQAQNNKFISVATPSSEEHLALVATAKSTGFFPYSPQTP